MAVDPFFAPGDKQDPYVDYGRYLTPEGGVLFIYKDIDTRLRHTLWRLLAWTAWTGPEFWYVLHDSPVHRAAINGVCLIAVAVVNWLIVRKPVELYRRVELRPDCMILEGTQIFWRRLMENGLPTFYVDEDGNQILYGPYGTRFVEYVTIRRFDEYDGMPEVFGRSFCRRPCASFGNPLLRIGFIPLRSRPGGGNAFRCSDAARCITRSRMAATSACCSRTAAAGGLPSIISNWVKLSREKAVRSSNGSASRSMRRAM